MQLQTIIPNLDSKLKIAHSDKVITIGSCFAENIAEKFKYFKFDVLSNPFGVLYNPVSIYNSFKAIAEDKIFTEEDLVYNQSEWHSFYHHSDFSFHEKDKMLENLNASLKSTKEFLRKSDLLIVTFGTAFVYRHVEKGIVVSNCHKLPRELFEHYMLGMYEAREFIQAAIELAGEINPKLKILLTVSPVRHWKDGAVENQKSKAILLLAVHEIVNEENSVFYFPSYEIMIDELRDYRFYDMDLVHPNKLAVEYIWEKFSENYFTESTIEAMKKAEKISLAVKHRTRNPKSERHKTFIESQISYIKQLKEEYSYLNLDEELKHFESQLKNF